MHLALYRQFRPKTFDEVIGQDHIVSALKNQVMSGNIGHAYLFTGTRGIGKTSCAKIFSKAINCLHPVNGSACGKCEVCKALNDPSNVDILEIDAASNNGVDEIRNLREKIKYPPITAKYKVYIIDEVHMLTDSAFNALLKTLEEPPSHAVFILATTEAYRLPATILSRCMRFDFRLVSKQDLMKLLKRVFEESKITCDDDSIEAIALAGEGSVRDTLSVADCVVAFSGNTITFEKTMQILGTSDRNSVIALCNKIFEKNIGGVLDDINNICLAGKNLVSLGKEITVNLKDLLVIKNCSDSKQILNVTKDVYEKLLDSSQKIDTNSLIEFMKKFSAIESELKYALSPRTLIELTALECASFDPLKKN
jgi:DNA polymerase-3 subunit gamma/tau